MSKKKEKPILADKIAALIAPKKLLDPEIDSDDETAARNFDYDLENESDAEPQAFSDIRKKNVKLLHDVDEKYRGKVASRKDFDLESSDEQSAGDEEADSDEDDEGDEDEGDHLDAIASNGVDSISRRLTPSQRIKVAQEAAMGSGDDAIAFDDDSDGSDVENDLKAFREKLKKSTGNLLDQVEWGDDSDGDSDDNGAEGEEQEDDEEIEEEQEAEEDEEEEEEEEEEGAGEAEELEEEDGELEENLDDGELGESDDDSDDGESGESDFDGGDIVPKAPKEPSATESDLNSILPKNKSDEQLHKGYCVQNQLQIWEKLLEVRIHSQKMLIKANSLPSHGKFQAMKASDPEYKQVAEDTEKNLFKLTAQMNELQKILLSRYPETKEIASKRKSVGKIEDAEAKRSRLADNLADDYNNFKEYQYSVISKWHDRTKLLTPGSIKTQKQQGNIDVLRKIEAVLANRDDLVKKSQLVKGTYELFDQSHVTTERKQQPDEQAAGEGGSGERNTYCSEIYDDTDFYHTQLRELIEYKSNASTDANEMVQQFNELQRMRKRMKKEVDTRASKGRKIRYVVHNKLVSFMAPNDNGSWTDDQRSELFKSLFGAQA